MAQRNDVDYMGILFQYERDGTKHIKWYKTLFRMIVPTRYADDSCLCNLGLYDSVDWMLNKIYLSYFSA